MAKVANAVRKSGMLYDVFYPYQNCCDFDVPWSYLEGLRRKGYTVELDQSKYRPEGEPVHETYRPLAD